MRTSKTYAALLTTATILAGLTACTSMDMQQALENQKPKVSVTDQRLTGLDFERITIAFGIKVDNPNPVDINLAGLDYDLKLGGRSFISGKQDKAMKIAASGASRVELPLSMSFKEIQQGISELKDKDQVPYELTTGLMIQVPLLGTIRYPVVTQGVLPVPRMPTISLQSLKLEKLTFSGATLSVNLQVDNPNDFSVALNALNYALKINGKHWASGNSQTLGAIQAKQKNTISLPVTINLMDLGNGFSNLLASGEDLNYSLSGKLDANSSHALIGRFALPFDTNGRVKLSQ